MPQCPICGANKVCANQEQHHAENESLEECRPRGAVWVHVTDDVRNNVRGVDVTRGTAKGTTDGSGLASFDPLEPGQHTVAISLSQALAQQYDLPEQTQQTGNVAGGEIKRFTFKLARRPRLTVAVVQKGKHDKVFAGARVAVDGPGGKLDEPTGQDGTIALGHRQRGKHTITVTLSKEDAEAFAAPAAPLDVDLAADDHTATIEVEACNLVTPKLAAEYRVVLLDPELSKHQGSQEAVKHVADLTRIELSFAESSKDTCPYPGGGTLRVEPANVELYWDAKGTQKVATKVTAKGVEVVLTKVELPPDKAVPLYLAGKPNEPGKLVLALTPTDPKERLLRLAADPATLEMGVVKLELELHQHDAGAVGALAITEESDPISTHHDSLKNAAIPEQKLLTDEQKVKDGRLLHVQKLGSHGRAKLVCKKLDGSHWPDGADVTTFVLTTTATTGGVKLHEHEWNDTESDGKIPFADLKAGDVTRWIEGTAATDARLDVRIDLGIDRGVGGLAKAVKRNGNWVRLTVVEIEKVELEATASPNTPKVWSNGRFYVNNDADGSGHLLKPKASTRDVKVTAKLTKPIANVTVHFMLAPSKDNPATANLLPGSWKHANLKKALRRTDRPDAAKLLHVSATTNGQGVATTEDLALSRCGGDKLTPGAYIDQDPHLAKYVEGHGELGTKKPVLAGQAIEIWRALSYQYDAMTAIDGRNYAAARNTAKFEAELAKHFIEATCVHTGQPANRRAIANSKNDEWCTAATQGSGQPFLYMALVDTACGTPSSNKDAAFGPVAGGGSPTFTVLEDPIDVSDKALWLVSLQYRVAVPQGPWQLLDASKVALAPKPGNNHDFTLTVDLSALDSSKQYALKLTYIAWGRVSGLAWSNRVLIDMRHRYKFGMTMPDSPLNTALHEAGHYLGLAAKTLPDQSDTSYGSYYYQWGNHCHANNDGCIMWDSGNQNALVFCATCGLALRARPLHAPPVWGANTF